MNIIIYLLNIFNKSIFKEIYFMYLMDEKGDVLYKYIMDLNFL